MVEFCTIASGSSGNCACVGFGDRHFLVDAGLSGKRIENALHKMNVRALGGIFITHEHRDHIAGVGVMARRFKLNIYATPQTWRYFAYNQSLGALNAEQIKVIEPGKPVDVGGVKITAFDISHDAEQPVGYTFEAGNKKAACVTDLGEITDTVRNHLSGCNILMLESNHDPEMLRNGPYPYPLKKRISGPNGHISNAEAGYLLTEIMGDELEYVFLAHLSEDNNTPMLAYETVRRILDVNGLDLKGLAVAERHSAGPVVRCE